MAGFTVREARESDCESIHRLIVELAEFERMQDQVRMDVKTLKEDGFGNDRLFHCLVAETTNDADERVVGYLLYFWAYSTWLGRSLYVEDLYVAHTHRRRGIASALWDQATQIARARRVSRMQWSVLEWNQPAIQFYKKLGAVDLTEKEGWKVYRRVLHLHQPSPHSAVSTDT